VSASPLRAAPTSGVTPDFGADRNREADTAVAEPVAEPDPESATETLAEPLTAEAWWADPVAVEEPAEEDLAAEALVEEAPVEEAADAFLEESFPEDVETTYDEQPAAQADPLSDPLSDPFEDPFEDPPAAPVAESGFATASSDWLARVAADDQQPTPEPVWAEPEPEPEPVGYATASADWLARNEEPVAEVPEPVAEVPVPEPVAEVPEPVAEVPVPEPVAESADQTVRLQIRRPLDASSAAAALEGAHVATEDEETSPIFGQLQSNWLNDEEEATETQWSDTEVDRGWEAAERSEGGAFGTTTGGLPVRRPGGRLVPGGVTPEPANNVVRDPEAIRNRLAAHAAGVSRGRAAAAAQPSKDDYAHEETGPA